MSLNRCSTCSRSNGDLEPGNGPSDSREVSLASIYDSAIKCAICAFVKEVLAQDVTTPKVDDGLYQSARVKVDDSGLRFTGQWQGALVIELYKPGDQPKLPKPEDVQADISSDLAASTINKWMHACQEHDECNSYDHPSPFDEDIRKWDSSKDDNVEGGDFDTCLPKRLIWLHEDASTAQLVPFPEKQRVQYAALSYCWGTEGTFKTEEHTLKEFSQDIPLYRVPQTLKDAFILTKKIGLNYLWVDALCIVQGAKREWEDESGKMGRIYSNARIVLSATRSSHVNEGILIPRKAISLSQDINATGNAMCARRNLNHEIITSCRTKSDKWWETNINITFPLLSRGWGFQERILAKRTVHFTPTELVWECQNTRKCECRVVESNLYGSLNNMVAALRTCLEQPDNEKMRRQMWRELVRSYSVRRFTIIEDKLPALSGIAALLQNRPGDEYAAGLWNKSMPFDLLWRCDQSGKLDSKKIRSPSWSWISVDGAVKWPVCQEPDTTQPLRYISSTTYFEGGAEGVEVCHLECNPEGQNKFGRVKSGTITLMTRLADAKIQPVQDEEWNELYETTWEIRVGDSKPSPVWPDLNTDGLCDDSVNRGVSEKLYVMEVMKLGGFLGSWEEALLVREKKGPEKQYERIGVAANVLKTNSKPWKTVKSWFDSPHDKVTLV